MSDEIPLNSTTAIQVSLARIEERQEASMHRVRNVDLKIDALTIKLDKYAEKTDLEPLSHRVDALESQHTWLIRAVIVAGAVIISGLYTIGRKVGFLS